MLLACSKTSSVIAANAIHDGLETKIYAFLRRTDTRGSQK